MSKKKRTYRVPKKVATQSGAAFDAMRENGVGVEQGQAAFIAQALSSSAPVTYDVPLAVAAFFTPDWRHDPSKMGAAQLYGGEPGRDWAKRCMAMLAATEPPSEMDEEFTLDELFEFTDEETDAILAFFTSISEEVPEAAAAIEKVADIATEVLESELTPDVDEDEDVPDLSPDEMSMVHAALAEVADGSPAELADVDFAIEAAEARERVAKVALARERSLAMAKMASARMTLAAEAPVAPVESAEAPADADPKAPGPDHHASRQVRDWHGRFAKTGARVRSKAGSMGYVKGVDENGQLIVTGDDGVEHTVDPKSIEVISKKTPARLPQPMELVEDPKARLESYLEWAKDQMGVGGK